MQHTAWGSEGVINLRESAMAIPVPKAIWHSSSVKMAKHLQGQLNEDLHHNMVLTQ